MSPVKLLAVLILVVVVGVGLLVVAVLTWGAILLPAAGLLALAPLALANYLLWGRRAGQRVGAGGGAAGEGST